jgi:hypothetical protein
MFCEAWSGRTILLLLCLYKNFKYISNIYYANKEITHNFLRFNIYSAVTQTMEAFEETVKEGSKRGSSFIDHVFRLDEQQQGSILNIVQYTIIAFIPVILVLYLIRTYVPDPDETKGSLLILGEIIGQVLFMFIGIYFIHRLITYIPTYSGYRYGDFNFTTVILGLLLILLSIKTKLGEKVQILVERAQELWTGESSLAGSAGNANTSVRVTQPLSQQYVGGAPGGPMGGGLLPPPPAMTANRNTGTADYGLAQAAQQNPNFNNTYANSVGGGMPGGMGMFEPMAANEMGGFTRF